MALHALAIVSLVTLGPDRAAVLLSVGFVATGSLAVASYGRGRPWSDAAAWAMTLTAVVLVGNPDSGLRLVATVVALLASLHLPAAALPGMRGVGVVVQWGLASAAAVLLVLGPAWSLAGRSLGVIDPVTAQGTALRLAATLLIVSAAVMVIHGVMGRWGRSMKLDPTAPQTF